MAPSSPPGPTQTPGGGTLTRPTDGTGDSHYLYYAIPVAIVGAAVVTLAAVVTFIGMYKYRQRQAVPEKM